MALNIHPGLLADAATFSTPLGSERHDLEALASRAREYAQSLAWAPASKDSQSLSRRLHNLHDRLDEVFALVNATSDNSAPLTDDQRWLFENTALLRTVIGELVDSEPALTQLVYVRNGQTEFIPRVVAISQHFLSLVDYEFRASEFTAYIRAFQTAVVLNYDELWALVPALKLVLLSHVVEQTHLSVNADTTRGISKYIRSLRLLGQESWSDTLQPLIVFDQLLREDPARAYSRMDTESRELYQRTVVRLSRCSDCSEMQIAQLALSLARESLQHTELDPNLKARQSHVGYYLIAEGRYDLYRHAHVRLPYSDRLLDFLRRYPSEYYLSGIEILTSLLLLAVLWRAEFQSLWTVLFAAMVLLLPCSQAAVEVMNYLTTSLFRPQILPKLDFRDGVPEECLTLVAVPVLLLNEKQVRRIVHDLEVRYVGNSSPNLHFALLTDLPDSHFQPNENDPLVELCGRLIDELNRKYAHTKGGRFAMLHRHRVYNAREGVWMGWERKRGKLLDLNKLILGEYDSFPYKSGDLSFLPHVRYVLTLDIDTELPRGAAQKLIGTLAHPLCAAIIDPHRRVVVEGYGILQPRVGVSVESAAQSRLASIYSGQTGFDIYTRAVSDVYQDLCGEGTFVGKGLYDVRTLHKVLDRRFPRNSLLSHDLIEGTYTRAGLVSDVEVVDHYPSHYSAYIRRKHRWLRGDWQLFQWLFSRVPDESGHRVPNPISVISRWKIFDNLRRSLVEPGIFALLVLGWTVLPGSPLYWTAVTLGILFAPPFMQFAFSVVRSITALSFSGVRDALGSLFPALVNVLLTVTFLAHNALVALDAVFRTLYRRIVSGRRLLEWETAAEAEIKSGNTPVDRYLNFTPVVALAIYFLAYLKRPKGALVAIPILCLWACSKLIALWLDLPPRSLRSVASPKDTLFLRRTALRTWRYFREFSTPEHNWLIPDNVQESPDRVAARVSPTNIGLLLNARQVACELGYVTVPDLAEHTLRTFHSMARLERWRGHLLNWYDTHSLSSISPRFVSSVDNGNLEGSLITLKNGCAALLEKPLLSPTLLEGYDDILQTLADFRLFSRRTLRMLRTRGLPSRNRLISIAFTPAPAPPNAELKNASASWFVKYLGEWRASLQQLISGYMPWLAPNFSPLVTNNPELQLWNAADEISPSQLPSYIERIQSRIQHALLSSALPEQDRRSCEVLFGELANALVNANNLVADLRQIVESSERWINEMNFRLLFDSRRKLLSIGYEVEQGSLHPACYDLLASEASAATFIAIAKGDIPQESWFRLGRCHIRTNSGPALVSWSGTMFEYLMPSLWMRSYSGTLLNRTKKAVIREQQTFAAERRIPWGISESAYFHQDEAGNYQYRAFGIPQLSIENSPERLVVAPYATLLALERDPANALKNLRSMARLGLFGSYSFYESADFSAARRFSRRRKFNLVRCWMAHHEGMSLLAIANFLLDGVVQKWFHSDPQIQANELLLQERPTIHHVGQSRRPNRSSGSKSDGTTTEKKLALAS